MSNPYFKFKQFTVYHDRCAMKVGTDGVVLGAWTHVAKAKTVLDIGTGTGLIALMLAQRNEHIRIDAIDIVQNAIEQAQENINRSTFCHQINCKFIALQDFAKQCNKEYDLIVSNPPFFTHSLRSPNQQRTLARHTDSLFIEELLNIASTLLNTNGKLSLIFPFEHKDMLINLGKRNELFISRITNVYPTPNTPAKRVLMEFSKQNVALEETDLVIEKERHIYADNFRELVKDFYLKL